MFTLHTGEVVNDSYVVIGFFCIRELWNKGDVDAILELEAHVNGGSDPLSHNTKRFLCEQTIISRPDDEIHQDYRTVFKAIFLREGSTICLRHTLSGKILRRIDQE